METRANYVLIGACALVGILLGLGFFVWLAKFQIDRQYAYYDVLFDNVAGLSRAGDVRFSGLSVGQVVSLDLAGDQGGQVRVRVEVAADTPIHEGATAQLQAQGVTGVSAVAITPGDTSKPLLRTTTSGVPVIQGQRSVVQSLTEDAPDLLTEVDQARPRLPDRSSAARTRRGSRRSSTTSRRRRAPSRRRSPTSRRSRARSPRRRTRISGFTDRLDPIAEELTGALSKAQTTLVSMSGAFDQAGTTLGTADVTLKTVDGAASAAGDLIREDGTVAVAAFKQSVVDVQGLIATLGAQVKTVLAAYGDTATVATARLEQVEPAIASLDKAITGATTALASVDAAATSFDALVDGDGTALVAEARTTLASIQVSADAIEKVATDDLPDDHRRGAAGVDARQRHRRQGVDRHHRLHRRPRAGRCRGGDGPRGGDDDLPAGERDDRPAGAGDRRRPSGRLPPPRAPSPARSGSSPPTWPRRPQTCARRPSGCRSRSTRCRATSRRSPGSSRRRSPQATATVQRVDGLIQQSAGPLNQFTTQGLPQFTRFTVEAQGLVQRLDRIAAQLERDPARFLLGGQPPDFRR